MSGSAHLTTGLIALSGLGFRQQQVLCAHCSWKGLAGKLRTPQAFTTQDQGETMAYACPVCGQVIAIHKGLSAHEVLQEVLAIREILKDELSMTRYQPQAGVSETSVEGGGECNFTAELNKMVPDIEISDQSTSLSLQSRNSHLTTSQSQSQSPERQELDFAVVRGRLAGIAEL
jgi:hypothetical protein